MNNLQNIEINDFNNMVLNAWAKDFDTKAEKFSQTGTEINIKPNYKKKMAVLWKIGKRTILNIHPDLKGEFDSLLKATPKDFSLDSDHVISFFEDKQIEVNNFDDISLLFPQDLKLIELIDGEKFLARKLTLDDKDALDKMHSFCSQSEIGNSFVEVDELGAWGCFDIEKNILVSAVGFSDWGAFADFGIITHPDYRGRGLAKSILSYAADDAIRNENKLPIYRCHITLFSSLNTGKSVGFKIFENLSYRQDVLNFE